MENWITLDIRQIFDFLQERENPVEENTLIHHFFSDFSGGLGLNLFRIHFNLYHYLYKLKDQLEEEGCFYLHLRLSNCYLLKVPESGCIFFQEDQINFCTEPAQSDFCHHHEKTLERLTKQALPGGRGMRSYYLDLKNYKTMDEDELDRLTRGISLWASSPEELDKSLKRMNLPHNFTLKRLKNRYRYLARKHHPDINGSDHNFQEIHEAYQLLKSWKESSMEKRELE